jgi:hypothetical protein
LWLAVAWAMKQNGLCGFAISRTAAMARWVYAGQSFG